MTETQTGVRVELATPGEARAATGLPVLDHLLGELAATARLRIALEVEPGSAEEEVAAAGRALGTALAEPARRAGLVGPRLGDPARRRGARERRRSRSPSGRSSSRTSTSPGSASAASRATCSRASSASSPPARA